MFRITLGIFAIAILVAFLFQTDIAASPHRMVDASIGHVEYIRGYVRWQPVDDAPWQRLTEGERIPARGRVALGMSAVFIVNFGSAKQTYATGGIYELPTGEASSYVPRDTDPPGIKSMPKPKPNKAGTNHANFKPLPDEVTITAAKGLVQWRQSDGDKWTKATVGTKLKIDAQVRTGLRSAITLTAADGRSITIDRLGVTTLTNAWNSDGKVKTDIGLKYGRAHYHVPVAGEEHHSKIHAPSVTLAVRGMVAVAKNVPLSEVFYPSFGPFSALDTRSMILDNWPERIVWVMECRRISPVIWEQQRTKHRVRQAVEEHEATYLSPPATLAERSQSVDVGLDLNNQSLWYQDGVLLSITPTVDELLKSLGLPLPSDD